MKFFIIFLLLIIFTPLPLKFSISINNKKYSIKLYNHTLLRKKNKKHKKINFKNVIKLLRSNKFKPIAHLSGSIYYEIPKKDIEKMIFSPIRIKEKYDDEREIMDGESIIINGGEYDEK